MQQKINCDVRYIVDAGANIRSATVCFLFDCLESMESILRGVKILAIEVHEEVMDKYLLVEYLEKLNFKHISFGKILYAYRPS